jgi:hypothetical protein
MARGIVESGLFRQERVKLNQRTSDPSSPQPGETWLRLDQNSETDKYGELRFYNGNSVQSVAIVAPGTTETEAEEVLRVATPSGIGVIPVSPRADAQIPQWSFQHNGNSFGLGQPSAIPDSEDLRARYDATAITGLSDGDSVGTLEDQTGNGHDLTQGTTSDQPTYQSSLINGNAGLDFTTGEFMTVSWADLSPPYHIFIVAQINNSASGSNQYVYDNVNSNTVALRSDNTPEFGFFQDSAIQFGFSADTNEHIFSALHGSTANLRVDGNPPPDGSQSASGNVLSGFTLSAFNTGEFGAELDFGEVLIYTQDKSSIVGDVESYLSDKWGFEI